MSRNIYAIGDVHGHHQQAVQLCRDAASVTGLRPNIIVQVGDFNSACTQEDVDSVPAPARYRVLGDFAEYGSKYPAEVVFIGGNHEPVRALEPAWGGGEVAPGVRFLGRSGVVERYGLRIAGLSGNYRGRDYARPLSPLASDNCNKKEQLYIRKGDTELLLGERPVDILLMHDWPRRLAECAELPFGRLDSERGYREGDAILDALRPRIVLLGHMHWYKQFVAGGTQCISLAAACDTTASARERCAILRVYDSGEIEMVRW